MIQRLAKPLRNQACNGIPRHDGTAILLLHEGQPRTSVYLTEHLSNTFYERYRIPPFLSRKVISTLFKNRTSKCLRNSQDYPYLNNTLNSFSRDVERSLAKLIPEFAPFTCLYNTSNSDLSTNNILSMMEKRIDHLIIVSLHPFNNGYTTKALVNSTLNELNKYSFKKVSTDGNHWHKFLATNRKSISFSYLILDEIGTNEAFLKCWAHELIRTITPDVDGIIFAAPSAYRWRKYSQKNFHTLANEIVREIHENSDTIVLRTRVAYFSSWNETFSLPYQTINDQVLSLRKLGSTRKILVVPITKLFDDFDLQTILPSLLQELEDVDLVRLEDMKSAMLHTLIELLKTRIIKLNCI